MARKASDLVLLLGSRGGGRGRGRSADGVLGAVAGAFGWLLGGGRSYGGRAQKPGRGHAVLAGKVPGWLVLAVALACFGGGFFVGDKFGGRAGDEPGLRAELDGAAKGTSGPQQPGIIEDTKPLSNNAFFVAAYAGVADEEARGRASLLAGWLVEHGLANARPYQMQTTKGLTWFVVVYYSGTANCDATRALLQGLPESVPDANFVHFKNVETNWPPAYPIR